MPDTILIAAISGRALAASARRAGYAPLVVDLFGDLDTREIAAEVRVADGDLETGFDAASLVDHLAALAARHDPVGLVCGAGFEDRPALLGELARHWPLLGNPAEAVARVKHPGVLADLCAASGVPHPMTTVTPPADPRTWIVKRQGGSGGIHVKACGGDAAGDGAYFQRRVGGTPVSALVLADGRRAVALGLSAQWSSPSAAEPFRYGGAVRPAPVDAGVAAALSAAAERVVGACRLVGLNSVDFLVADDGFHLLEINPRPGATLDVFVDRDGALFRAHLAACRGECPDRPLRLVGAEAAAIVYARHDVAATPAIAWPRWCADRQPPGTPLRHGDPICTVLARAAAPAAARDRVAARANTILARIEACQPAQEDAA